MKTALNGRRIGALTDRGQDRGPERDGGVMESSFRIGRVGPIEIGIHYTWLFAFALVTWSLASGFFPSNYPGWGTATYWLVGLLAALALFACVLVHELSHSFVALARGQGVHGITLFIFGGVSNLKTEAQQPKDEFLVSVVGPLTSFGLAAACWLLLQALRPGNSPLGAALTYLTFINVLLGAFNLLPGFPLDGGRVLRSIVWAATGNLRRATDVASYVGQGFGGLLVLLGILMLVGGNVIGGIWMAFIGLFLNSAAESTRQQQRLQENLRGVLVSALMDPDPPLATSAMTVQEFVFDHVLREGRRALLVVDDQQLRGLVSITDAKKVPQEAWPTTSVGAIMTRPPLKTIAPDADLQSALELLVHDGLNQLPVVRGGLALGMLSRADVLRFLQLRDELQLQRLPAGPGRRAAPDSGR
jgi:Zn-dependent protease/CBS domain-containing protein